MTHGRSLPTLLAALVLMALTLALAQPERASAAASMSAAITTPDPAQELKVEFAVSGDTGSPSTTRNVYMYQVPGAATCAPSFDTNNGGGTTYAFPVTEAGSFSTSRSFTPDTAGTWTVCFYLATSYSATADAVTQTTFTVRRLNATVSVAIEPDARGGKQNRVTASGNVEVGRKLYMVAVDGGAACPSSYADDSVRTYGVINGSRYVGPGDFSAAGVFGSSGHYRFCAWLAKDDSSSADASGALDVDIRRPYASISIAMDRSPYLLGAGKRTATVTASSESATTIDLYQAPVSGSCYPSTSGGDHPSTLSMPAITVDPERSKSATVCAYMYDGRTVVASDTVTINELPVSIPVAADGAPKGMTTERRPSFAWSSGAGFTDDLVLSDRDGTTLLLVGSDGAWVPSGGASQGGQTLKQPAAIRKGYDRVPGAATYTAAGGRVTVDVKQQLPPGAYRWSVNRTRSDGESAKMAPVAFKIAGPDVTKLNVKTTSFPVANSRHPGHSELKITTTPWAYVRIALSRGGRRQVQNVRWDGSATHALSFTWTCKATGGAYAYAITASDDDGHSFTRKGRIKTISHARCASLRAAERRKVGRRVAQRRRREAAAQRRRDAAARARLQKQIDQCHSIDGVVRTWEWGDGTETLFCVTPFGALVM